MICFYHRHKHLWCNNWQTIFINRHVHNKMTSSVENVESCINLMQKVSNEKSFEINFHNFYCNSHFIVAKGSFQLRERVGKNEKERKTRSNFHTMIIYIQDSTSVQCH